MSSRTISEEEEEEVKEDVREQEEMEEEEEGKSRRRSGRKEEFCLGLPFSWMVSLVARTIASLLGSGMIFEANPPLKRFYR